ncbi:MAG: hypothetical protein V1733_03335 [bacterium]
MRKNLIIPLFCIPSLACQSQDVIYDTVIPSASEGISYATAKPASRFKTTLSLGTEFSSSSWYGSGLSTYISPAFSYRVNARLSFRAGVTLSNTALFNYQPWYMSESFQPVNANFSKALLFVEGTYLVSERLTLSGGAFKEFTLDSRSPVALPFTTNNPEGFYLNADYKIANGVHIQAGFGYTKGYVPFYGSPLYDPSPFYRNSFTPGFPGFPNW